MNRLVEFLRQELFLVPAFSSGLLKEQDRYGFLTLKKGRSTAIVRSVWSEAGEPLPAFVTRLGVQNTLVTVTLPETALFNRIASAEEMPDPGYDALMDSFCPKGMDHDQVLLDTLSLGKDGTLLISIAKEAEVAKLVAETEESGLVVARVGCGIHELGTAFGAVAGKDFTGAVLLMRETWSAVVVYEQGLLSEAERIPAGAVHFRENPRWYLNEVLRFMVYFWETRLLKEPVRKVILAGEEAGLADTLRKSGLEVISGALAAEASANPMGYALALNSLAGAGKAVNHKHVLGERALRIRRINFGTAILHRFAYPILVAAILLLLGVSGGLSLFNHRFEIKHGDRRNLIEAIRVMDKENRVMAGRLHAAASLKAESARVSEILARLSVTLPEGAWLSAARLKDNGRLVVEGVSRAESGVAAFQDALAREALFKDVRLKFSERTVRQELRRNSREDLGESLVRFGFELSINPRPGL